MRDSLNGQSASITNLEVPAFTRFFPVGGFLKDHVYKIRPQSIVEFKKAIIKEECVSDKQLSSPDPGVLETRLWSFGACFIRLCEGMDSGLVVFVEMKEIPSSRFWKRKTVLQIARSSLLKVPYLVFGWPEFPAAECQGLRDAVGDLLYHSLGGDNAGIHHHRGCGIGSRVCQGCGIREGSFDGLEGHPLGGDPLKGLRFSRQGITKEGGGHVRQETAMVINHSHKLLPLPGGGVGNLVTTLTFYTIWGDLAAKKLDLGGTEGALVKTQETIILESLENFAYMGIVLFSSYKDEEVIHVADAEREATQNAVYHALEGCPSS